MMCWNNKGVAVWGSIFGCLVVLEFTALFLANAKLAQEKRTLKQLRNRWVMLQNRAPFPSDENVAVLQENLDGLEYHVGELAFEVMRDPFRQDAVEATDFSAQAQAVIERFQDRAALLGVILPESLEVGFADYASGGAVPKAEHVPRLSLQLYSVECVADVLVQSGVDSIDRLTRDIFEKTAESAPPRRRRGRGAMHAGGQKTNRSFASKIGPNNLFYIERIGVSFSAKEDVVWQVLNSFAAAPHFMVVSKFSHTTKSTILEYNPESGKHAVDDETLHYLSGGILVGEKALSRPERIIAGNESIQVNLILNVYNFLTVADLK